MKDIDIPGLPNLHRAEPGFISGGQPSAAQLEAAATAGIRRVINLRLPSEDAGFDEATLAEKLGLAYLVLGVAGPQGLNRVNVEKFDVLLAESAGTPTLVHCGSGARVGALIALRAAWLQGQSPTQALETGRRWGLTSKLEPIVTQLLG